MSEEVLVMHRSKNLSPFQKRLCAFLDACYEEGLSRDTAFKLYALARDTAREGYRR